MTPATAPKLAPQAVPRLHWDLFCRVIDNHGDLGVCWRLATDLAGRGHRVRLWVDDASALAWMAPHGCAGVQVRAWGELSESAAPGDVVVEAFGCDPPAGFVAQMAARAGQGGETPLWINLEYLSAEAYVERSHGLASPQFSGPGRGLTKWFWFPGFTPRTGGLLREPGLLDRRRGFDRRTARAEWLRRFDPSESAADTAARLALLFCYDNPALPAWLNAMSRADRPWCVLVTPGLAMRAVERWWRARSAQPSQSSQTSGGAVAKAMRLGSLSLLPLAHVDQQRFDELLWASDLNFVRGEDSFVRAHWAGQPFIWQAYVQDDGAQHAKVVAWLQACAGAAPGQVGKVLAAAHLAWNNAPGATAGESDAVLRDLFGPSDGGGDELWSSWCSWAEDRSAELAGQGDLVTQLLGFVALQRHAPEQP